MIWQIFSRLPGAEEDWASECYAHGVIAVGWSEVGSLKRIKSVEQVKERFEEVYADDYDALPRSVHGNAYTLWRFVDEVAVGDVIITPDAKGKRYYVGVVRSGYFFQRKRDKSDTCPFLHRRRIGWRGSITRRHAQRIWGTGRVGSMQTVARVNGGEAKLRRLIASKGRGKPKVKTKQGGRPDPVWGRAAEERALKWLKEQGANPKDVADLNLGWDIECGDLKYEVKGRRSPKTVIRLTENEYIKAKTYTSKYTILVFTASSEADLRRSIPERIVDPVRTREWALRTVREYILAEDDH